MPIDPRMVKWDEGDNQIDPRMVKWDDGPEDKNSPLGNIALGALKGASDIGRTLLYPLDAMGVTGRSPSERKASIASLMQENADTGSLSFKGGELAADIAGTAGAGGMLAKGLRMIPGVASAAPSLASAIETGGFRLGVPAATSAREIARNAGTRIAGGAITGGASAGLINPSDILTGAALGGAMPVVGAAAGELGRAAKATIIDPLVNQDQLIANALGRAVGAKNIGAIQAAQTTPATSGVRFSTGQSTGNPALMAMEDALKAVNPGGTLNALDQSNRNYLANAMRGLAQDDIAKQAATQARDRAAAQLYNAARNSEQLADPRRVVNLIDRLTERNPANKALVGPLNSIRESLFESYPATQRGSDAWKALDGAIGLRMSQADSDAIRAARTVMDRVRKGTIDATEAVDALKGIQATSKTASDALDMALKYMKTPDYVVMQEPYKLISAMDNIKAMMGNKENAFIRGQLNTVKNALAHQIGKAAPEFRQAEKTFSQMSRPINQMDVGELLSNKLLPATSGADPARLNAAQMAGALRHPDQVAKTATGFKRAKLDRVMDPEQLAMIEGVNSDASRIAEMMALGAGHGSPTARRQSIQNFIGDNIEQQAPMTSAIIAALGRVPGINYATHGMGAVGNMIGSRMNSSMADKLEMLLASDPQAVKALLMRAKNTPGGLLSEPVLPATIRAGLLASPGVLAAP